MKEAAAGGTGRNSGHGDEREISLLRARRHVDERDVLAYIAYYGRRCRDMEAQLGALIHIVGEKEASEEN